MTTSQPVAFSEPLTFEGARLKHTKRALLRALPVAALLSMGGSCATAGIVGNRPPQTSQITSHVQWDPDIRVLASSSQWVNSFKTKNGSYYTRNLLYTLHQPNVRGFEEAQRRLEMEGYFDGHNSPALPFSTPTAPLGIWQKADRSKQRFVLLVTQSPESDIDRSGNRNNLRLMRETLQSTYGVPASHILTLSEIDRQSQLVEGVEWLVRQAQIDPGSTEVLIYYAGHGNVRWPNTNPILEGDGEGFLGVGGFREAQLKQLLNGRLNGAQGLIIMQTCHSGSWIAKADPAPGQEPGERLSRIG